MALKLLISVLGKSRVTIKIPLLLVSTTRTLPITGSEQIMKAREQIAVVVVYFGMEMTYMQFSVSFQGEVILNSQFSILNSQFSILEAVMVKVVVRR